MITAIYYSSRFKKQLDLLLKADKVGMQAAQKAEDIIDEVRRNGGHIPQAVNLKRTKHGERRVQNCNKYDLGAGYRLITLRDGPCLYVAFVGTHDECDLWFKKQRDNIPRSPSLLVEVLPNTNQEMESSKEKSPFPPIQYSEDEYESELLSRIDDATLRAVFSGLC